MKPSLRTIAFVGIVAAWSCGIAGGQQAARRQPATPVSALPPALLQKPTGAPFAVKPVDRTTRQSVREAAARIDAILDARYAVENVEGSPQLDDYRFVRRAYLQLGGRIPTCDEVLRFLSSKDEDRRAELIDSLLESPDYVSRMFCLWADTLRLRDLGTTVPYEAYLDWVKHSIAENRPYDEWVREMLEADGKIWLNPAVGFQLRDSAMPLNYVDNTVKVFLGVQIGCAQCHDHPFAEWTQQQYYELAALTYGDLSGFRPIRNKKNGNLLSPVGPEYSQFTKWYSRRKELTVDGAMDPGQFITLNLYNVGHRPGPLALPSRTDADHSGTTIQPKVLWGSPPPDVTNGDTRAVFAGWVTSRDNRQFARNIANRLWKMLMGVGVVEPIDDFDPRNKPSHPELLVQLTDEVLERDFDVRELIRIIAYTDAWQSEAVPHDPTSETPFLFQGPALRRMTAEQLWDSILTLVAHDLWFYQRPTAADVAAAMEIDLLSDETGDDQFREALRRSAKGPMAFGGRRLDLDDRYKYRFVSYARASEIRTPLPIDHPLRVFGQSDRETIDGGSTAGSMAQAFQMLNGASFPGIVLEPGTVLDEAILARPQSSWIDVVFVSILTRQPDAEERAIAKSVMEGARAPREGLADVIMALLNTREFIFVQ